MAACSISPPAASSPAVTLAAQSCRLPVIQGSKGQGFGPQQRGFLILPGRVFTAAPDAAVTACTATPRGSAGYRWSHLQMAADGSLDGPVGSMCWKSPQMASDTARARLPRARAELAQTGVSGSRIRGYEGVVYTRKRMQSEHWERACYAFGSEMNSKQAGDDGDEVF